MSKWESKRLILQTLPADFYYQLDSGEVPNWEKLGVSNPYKHLEVGNSPIKHRIPRIEKDPSFIEIGLLIASEKSSGEIIGSSGFHDFPDSEGVIEIGFGVVAEQRNKGFGMEILFSMWSMILETQPVKIFRYTVSPNNLPSMHIINKLDFNLVGEQIDEEDGLELIYEKAATELNLPEIKKV
jgi:RimJ/RimL family protein N-acetyltransferase